MGSYVISVSAGTGCYRHIQISKSATLYRLHKAIINAFDFEDDHAHAFFMDNKYWSGQASFWSMEMRGGERLTKNYKLESLGISKGDQFKYLFDFGDEWRFQCKVLREEAEPMDIPYVVRRIGDSPEQYLNFGEWDEELFSEFDEEDDTEDEDEDEEIPRELIDRLYDTIPLDRSVVDCIHQYMDAAARLYGIVSLEKLHEIYNSQNSPVEEGLFAIVAEAVDCDENDYFIVEREEQREKLAKGPLAAGEIIADYLFLEDPDKDISALCRDQDGKPYKILPKEKFLKYAEPMYYPARTQRNEMIKYLRKKEAKLSLPAEDFCSCIQELIVMDVRLQDVLDAVQLEGLVFRSPEDLEEFVFLYQNLNNHTHKHANRGHTPEEMFAVSNRTKGRDYGVETGQMKLFDE